MMEATTLYTNLFPPRRDFGKPACKIKRQSRRLTPDEVRQIRESDLPAKELAKQFATSTNRICKVQRGFIYRGVGGPIRPSRFANTETKNRIVQLRREGLSYEEIGRVVCKSGKHCWAICKKMAG